MNAVFFDRDGTLIVNKHYLSTPTGIRFQNCTIELLKHLVKLNYKIFIITNQSGVKRGYYSKDRIDTIHREIMLRLTQEKVRITDIVYCHHHPKELCPCRKPNNLLLKKLIWKYDIDPVKSYVIGDRLEDVLLGKSLNLKTILLSSLPCNPSVYPDFWVPSLCDVFKIINE